MATNYSSGQSKRKQLFDILQIGDKSNFASRAFDFFIVIVIMVNILAMFMQTFSCFHAGFPLLRMLELITTLIFCVEYMLRIATADFLYPQLSKVKARLRFLISFDGIVDLCTILPAFFLTGFVAFRMLRVVRIFHLFRLNAQYDSFSVITKVLYEKKNQIASSVFIIVVLMMASSLCMYSAEHEAQPEVFRNAFSGIWWSVSTILTVGYGDIYPVTILGKVMATIIAFLGVGVVAIPTGIISAGFVEQYTKAQNSTDYRTLDISDIVEISVDSKLANRTIADIQENENFEIYLIIRNGLTLLPTEEMHLYLQDIIVARIHAR